MSDRVFDRAIPARPIRAGSAARPEQTAARGGRREHVPA